MTPGASGRAPRILFVPAVAGVLFLILPLGGLIMSVSWPDLAAELASEDVGIAVRLSLECSFAAAAVAIAIGVPVAYAPGVAT